VPTASRQLALLSVVELLVLGLWFSASAVLPALRHEWALGDAGSAGLTIAVQLGFIAGTLASALANLPDVCPPRLVLVWSAVLGAATAMRVLQAGSLHAYLAYVLALGVLLLIWLGGTP